VINAVIVMVDRRDEGGEQEQENENNYAAF